MYSTSRRPLLAAPISWLRHASARGAGPASWPLRIRRDYESGGLAHVLRHVGRKLASPLVKWGRLDFYVRDLSEPVPEPSPAQTLEFRRASPVEIPQLLLEGKPTTRQALAERFRREIGRAHV